MEDEKHGSKRNCYPRQKWLPVAAILLLVLLIAGFSVRYISFVSQTIYQESTSHLEEVLHKSNNMLKELVRKNVSYLHLYNGFLESTSDEAEIQAYIRAAQQEAGFAEFYFLPMTQLHDRDGGDRLSCLQTNLDEKLAHDEDVVVNTALPGKPQMLAFICPETQGSYRALPTMPLPSLIIMMRCLGCWTALPLRAMPATMSSTRTAGGHRQFCKPQGDHLQFHCDAARPFRSFRGADPGSVQCLCTGQQRKPEGQTGRHQLLSGLRGTAVQSWTMVGLVPVSIVNANLDELWFRTAQIVAGIAAGLAVLAILLIVRRSHVTLRRKDTEIRYRDELFQKLSLNVDDVFLMLDAKTSQTDYVSPNIERLLGIPWREVRQDVHALDKLGAPEQGKNFLDGLLSGQQREWDLEFEHLEPKSAAGSITSP